MFNMKSLKRIMTKFYDNPPIMYHINILPTIMHANKMIDSLLAYYTFEK